MINRKNYVFKEAIEQLNKERKSINKWYDSENVTEPNAFNGNYQQRTNWAKYKHDLPSASFNPFEVALNQDSDVLNPITAESSRSKSDAGFWGSFLNRVETSHDKNVGRRSDIQHYKQRVGISKMNSYDTSSVKLGMMSTSKLSVDTFSNKESSNNNNEWSTLSYEVSNSNRISDPKYKNIMLQKPSYESGDNTPTFTDDPSNPFCSLSYKSKIDEENEEE